MNSPTKGKHSVEERRCIITPSKKDGGGNYRKKTQQNKHTLNR